MAQETTRKARKSSAMAETPEAHAAAVPAGRALLRIVDDLMDTESLLATATAAASAEADVDPEDVQMTLVIVRQRLHAAIERIDALRGIAAKLILEEFLGTGNQVV